MSVTIRRGTLDVVEAAYAVFVATTADLEQRMGVEDERNSWLNEAYAADYWRRRRQLFEHLTRTGEHFWIAEVDGDPVGYARATLHDGLRELTEFFVLPGHQGLAIGSELLARAFPVEGARCRAVIGTSEMNALSRYLKAGVYPRFPIYYVSRTPEPVSVESDLTITPTPAGPEAWPRSGRSTAPSSASRAMPIASSCSSRTIATPTSSTATGNWSATRILARARGRSHCWTTPTSRPF